MFEALLPQRFSSMVEDLRPRRFNLVVEALRPWTNAIRGLRTDQLFFFFSARQFLIISEPKLLNLRPMSLLNFSLRNLFENYLFDLQPL